MVINLLSTVCLVLLFLCLWILLTFDIKEDDE